MCAHMVWCGSRTAIVNKIMEDHGGRLELESGIKGGARARLIFDDGSGKNDETIENAAGREAKDLGDKFKVTSHG